MITIDSVKCMSITEMLDSYSENELLLMIEDFKCIKNKEIEEFLKNNAIDFHKKHQAMTHLLFDSNRKITGYFSLSIKPINIQCDKLSNTELKKLLRIAEIEFDNNSINPSAYLIAQLGKSDDSLLDIYKIMKFINYYIYEVREVCGGVIEFLESENEIKLINLYEKCGFKTFNIRKSKSGEDRKLIQMYRLI